MNYLLTAGDSLELRDGRNVIFISSHPFDGACLIGETVKDSELETFEYQNIATINDKARTPTLHDRLNFLMPIYCGIELYAAPRRAEMERAVAAGHTGGCAIDWAISNSSTFEF